MKDDKNLSEKKSCSGKGKKYRELMGIKECLCSEMDPVKIVNAMNFSSKKPFRVSFEEDISVSWNKNTLSEEDKKEPKKLTPRDKMQKKEAVKKLEGKMGEFKKRYGKKAEGIIHAKATKEAKKKP